MDKVIYTNKSLGLEIVEHVKPMIFQEAEAGGGPIADRYGEELETHEDHHKQLRVEFAAIMAEIDEYDQNY